MLCLIDQIFNNMDLQLLSIENQFQPNDFSIVKLEHIMSGSGSTPSPETNRKNSRLIPEETKKLFIELITQKNISIKNASKHLRLSYSTAKKIYSRFRKGIKQRQATTSLNSGLVAGFRQIGHEIPKPITFISTFAGKSKNIEIVTSPSCPQGPKLWPKTNEQK